MKTKELKIEAPEGYEVDWENSSMNIIRFKPIKKKITYKDIYRELFLNKPSWRLIDSRIIEHSNCTSNAAIYHNLISTSNEQLDQLVALNKLMNVAKYLNGDWEPDFTNNTPKCYICYDFERLKLATNYVISFRDSCTYFKSKELALRAIDILGEEEVKKALGIFE
mgnify:CR=1 FL=1